MQIEGTTLTIRSWFSQTCNDLFINASESLLNSRIFWHFRFIESLFLRDFMRNICVFTSHWRYKLRRLFWRNSSFIYVTGDQASNVTMAVDSWRAGAIMTNQTPIMTLSYVLQIIGPNKASSLDLEEKRKFFRDNMTQEAASLGYLLTFKSAPNNIYEENPNKTGTNTYAIFDVVNLASGTDFVSKSALDTLQFLWTNISGNVKQTFRKL